MYEHYAQIAWSKQFNRYDHGGKDNMIKYGTVTPPLYDLRRIKTPVCIYHGNADIWNAGGDIGVLTDPGQFGLNPEVVKF